MIIKKFQANTETEAIMLAKEDLGKDAIVMNIKTIKPKGMFKIFRKTKVEVTAAVDEANSQEQKQESRVTSQFNAQIDEKLHPETKKESEEAKEAKELEEKLNSLAMLLEQQIENQKKENQKSAGNKPVKETSDSGEEAGDKEQEKKEAHSKQEDEISEKDSLKNKSIDLIIEQLTGNEVSYTYAKQIMDEITSSGNIRTLEDMLSLVYQKIILKIGEMRPISFNEEDKKPKVIFFVGPTGVGKTTTIAKLSSKLLLEEKKKIVIFTSDTYRIAAVEQIKTYANILSIPVEVVYEKDDLDMLLSKYKDYDYLLMDTAGRSHKNKEQIDDLKNLFDAFSEYSMTTYLVLSATTKYKDLKKITALYEDITDYNLIFTKLDETDAIAIAYCHHLQGNLPTTGNPKCKDWGDFIKQNPDKIL